MKAGRYRVRLAAWLARLLKVRGQAPKPHVGDISRRIDALADEMVEKHAKALKILADGDAASD
jgi:hypothetical protein